MWIDLQTKKTYNSRLDVKLDLGSSKFNKYCREKRLIYLTDEIREQIKNN